MTHPVHVVRSELRVSGVSSASTAGTTIYYGHYIAIGNDGKILIVDPRSIFTHRYDETVFGIVPPIFTGDFNRLKMFSSYVKYAPGDFWAKECVEEYVGKIIFGIGQNLETGRSDPISHYHWSEKPL